MPHKFLNCDNFDGNENFKTQSAILDVTPYKPKVLIIGTYNEENIHNNVADFFYGRNYFWPVISNISNNENILRLRRDKGIGIPPGNPTLTQILDLCKKFQLCFADLITTVLTQLANHDDKYLDLALGEGLALPNHMNIINFINNTPSITHVFITRKFNNNSHPNIKALWQRIIDDSRRGISFGKLLTPSGMGGIPNFIGLGRAGTIARYWIWVNHPQNPYGAFTNSEGYNHFDHEWLLNCGVNVNSF